MPKETSQTLDRGLRVLSVLADSPEGLTVTEVAAALGVSRTVVYRLIVTLEQHGLVRRGTDGRCRLGLAVLTLARQVQPLLRDAAMPVLRRLAEGIGATAYLGVVDGQDLLAVAVAEHDEGRPVLLDLPRGVTAYREHRRLLGGPSRSGGVVVADPSSGTGTGAGTGAVSGAGADAGTTTSASTEAISDSSFCMISRLIPGSGAVTS